MATNSSSAGYLLPGISPAPLEGDALDDLFQGVLSGITGIPGDLVRPRFQPEPPNQPDYGTDWVAFGISVSKADTFAFLGHDPTLNADILERDETLTVLHSFYGPNSQSLIGRYNDGIQIEQNRDALTAAGIKLVECQDATQLPALLKERWVKRFDCRTIFRRRIIRTYPVLTVFAGSVDLDNEFYHTIINPTAP